MKNDPIESEENSLQARADEKTGEKSGIEPKRMCFMLKPSLQQAGKGVEALEQPRPSDREMRPITGDGVWHADARALEQGGSIFFLQVIVEVKPDKPTQ